MNEVFGNLCQVATAKNLASQNVFNQTDVYQLFLLNFTPWALLNYSTLKEFEEHYVDILTAGRNAS